MTYTETVTSNGETVTGTLTDTGALSTLRRGLRYGSTVTVTADGTITITRTVLHPVGEDAVESKTVVVLTPSSKPSHLTKTQYEDLERIRVAGSHAHLRGDGRIRTIFCLIPQAATKRLLDRGLVVTTATGRVELSVAGRLAMAAYEHPARTTAPRGWHFPEDGRIPTTKQHRRHPFQVPDYSSVAICGCDFRQANDHRSGAARAARAHLEAALAASLIAA